MGCYLDCRSSVGAVLHMSKVLLMSSTISGIDKFMTSSLFKSIKNG